MNALLRAVSALVVAFPALPALAFDAAEAPAEKASPLVVISFLVLLFGGCAAYFVHLMRSNRKQQQNDRPDAD